MMHITSDINPDLLPQEVAGELEKVLQGQKPTLLLFSGGSALEIINHLSVDNEYANLTIGVLDERYGNEPANNNLAQVLEKPWIQRQQEKGALIMDFNFGGEVTLEAACSRADVLLKGWKEKYPEGQVVITQGFGSDAHTAGIFPDDKNVFEERFEGESWFVGYELPETSDNPHRYRGTVTNTFLRECVDYSFVYAKGESKRDVLELLQKQEIGLSLVHVKPVTILHQMKNTHVYTDVNI